MIVHLLFGMGQLHTGHCIIQWAGGVVKWNPTMTCLLAYNRDQEVHKGDMIILVPRQST